jgi:hypothetical protein
MVEKVYEDYFVVLLSEIDRKKQVVLHHRHLLMNDALQIRLNLGKYALGAAQAESYALSSSLEVSCPLLASS